MFCHGRSAAVTVAVAVVLTACSPSVRSVNIGGADSIDPQTLLLGVDACNAEYEVSVIEDSASVTISVATATEQGLTCRDTVRVAVPGGVMNRTLIDAHDGEPIPLDGPG